MIAAAIPFGDPLVVLDFTPGGFLVAGWICPRSAGASHPAELGRCDHGFERPPNIADFHSCPDCDGTTDSAE